MAWLVGVHMHWCVSFCLALERMLHCPEIAAHQARPVFCVWAKGAEVA